MKSLCFFISSIDLTGGTARVTTEIANQLSLLGYKVTILSMYGHAPCFKLNDKIGLKYVFKKKRAFKLFLPIVILKLRKQLSAISPDILINVDTALFIYSLTGGYGLKFKNIAWEHFNFKASLNSKIRTISRRLAASKSAAIVTLTHADRVYWKNGIDCKAPVYVINNPSPYKSINYSDKSDNRIVLSVGRLTAQKGFDRLIAAWSMVKPHFNHWQLHIVGSGELQTELTDLIKKSGVENTAKLIAATDCIEQHYQNAAIYCMASRFEGFPMVLLEAQSFGLPTISYDCDTGPSEILTPENGVLVENGNIAALADALTNLMNEEQKRSALGQQAFKDAAQYDIDQIIPQWISLFHSLSI
jgi:glycosyltransferase involved in cell wall biosynthesis